MLHNNGNSEQIGVKMIQGHRKTLLGNNDFGKQCKNSLRRNNDNGRLTGRDNEQGPH